MASLELSSSSSARKQKVKTAKPVKPAKPAKAALSTELVGDSDDESDEEGRSTAPKKPLADKKPTPNLTKPPSTNVTGSSAKASRKPELPRPNPIRDLPNSSGSRERVENEDEDDSGSETGSPSRAERPTHVRPKQTAARSSQATPSLEPLIAGKAPKKPIAKELNPTKDGKGHSRSEGDSPSSSESSESGSESESGSSDQTSLQSPRKRSPIERSTPVQTPQPFEPPPGFAPASVSFHTSSRTSEIFAPSNLVGKQIWHITAPVSVPLTSVKEVSSDEIQSGASVLSYKGAHYGLVPDSDVEQASNRVLLLPSIQRNDYKQSPNSIIKTLHLQQLVSLPSHAVSLVRPPPSATTVSYKKTPRPQPQGLRMRYHPFGASEDSGSEGPPPKSVNTAPEFRMPNPVEDSSQTKKRKRSESINGAQDVDISPAKLKRKKKKDSQENIHMNEGTIMYHAAQEEPNSEGTPQTDINTIAPSEKSLNSKENKATRRKRREGKQRQEPPDNPAASISALPADITKEAATIMPEEVVEGNPRMEHISPPKDFVEDRKKKKAERQKPREMQDQAATLS